jgi:UTP--glucose-1-phosphate uridylyltransferase
MKICCTLVPAAGLGTRFLPYTKNVPKEMLPLGNKPAIHFIAQESVDSGVPTMCLIISDEKQVLVDYFKPHKKIEALLQSRGKIAALESIMQLRNSISIVTREQRDPLGLGHAILMAEDLCPSDSYVSVMLPDDIIVGEEPALKQLIEKAKELNASVIAVQEVPLSSISAYGSIKIKNKIDEDTIEISGVLEKPAPDKAPSNLAIIGRYVFSPKIFPALRAIKKGAGGEYLLTDAIDYMIDHLGERVFAYKVRGKRYDVGTPAGWVEAVNGLALKK